MAKGGSMTELRLTGQGQEVILAPIFCLRYENPASIVRWIHRFRGRCDSVSSYGRRLRLQR